MNAPAQIAANYVAIGKGKANLPLGKMILLAILAGAFIALAGVAATFGNIYVNKAMGAAIFPAGLAMVLLAGSELFLYVDDRSGSGLASRHTPLLRPVYALPADDCTQCIFHVSLAEGRQANRPLEISVVKGQVFAAPGSKAIGFQQIQKCLKVVRLACKGCIYCRAQLISVRGNSLIAKPHVVADAAFLWIDNNRELMLGADQIAQPLDCLRGIPEVTEFALAVQRC